MQPIVSAQRLAWLLNIPLADLRALAREVPQHYTLWSTIDLVKGKARNFMVPDARLKAVQRRILARVLSLVPLPASLHGGVLSRSPETNARRHLAKPLLARIDIKDFFPSVDHRRIAAMFRAVFGCGREATWLLTRLTTFKGELPQGVPTSTMIANLLLADHVARPAEQSARAIDVDFTSFVDDMAFSGSRAPELINETTRAMSRVGLTSKRAKLKIVPSSQRQEVTGLVVNSQRGPSVSREKRDKIRRQIYRLSSAKDIEREIRSINGKLNHVRRFNPGSAERLRRQLQAALVGLVPKKKLAPANGRVVAIV
jgi:hypothetical protein